MPLPVLCHVLPRPRWLALAGACSTQRIFLREARRYSSLAAARPRAGFLDFLRRLAAAQKTSSRLEKALSRASLESCRYEILADQVIGAPESWLRGAHHDDVCNLLSASLPHIPPHIYMQLMRVSLKNEDALELPAFLVGAVLRTFRSGGEWVFLFALLDLFESARVSVPVNVMNGLLRDAAGLEDPLVFVTLYEYYRKLHIPPNALTYSTILLWNTKTSPPPLDNPTNSYTPAVTAQWQSKFASLLAEDIHKDTVVSANADSGAAHILESEGLIVDLVAAGEYDRAWQAHKSLLVQGTAPLGPSVPEMMALAVRSPAEFSDLLIGLRSLSLPDRQISKNIFLSPWAKSSFFQATTVFDGIFSFGTLSEELCKGIWTFLNQNPHLGICIIFARVLPPDLLCIILHSFARYSKDPSASIVRAMLEEKNYQQAKQFLLGKGIESAVREKNWLLSINLIKVLFVNSTSPAIPAQIKAVVEGACKTGLLNEAADLVLMLAGESLAAQKPHFWNALFRAFFDHGLATKGRVYLKKLWAKECLPSVSKIYGAFLLTKDHRVLKNLFKVKLEKLALQDSATLSACLAGILRRNLYELATPLLKDALRENPEIVHKGHFSFAIQAAVYRKEKKTLSWLVKAVGKKEENKQIVRSLEECFAGKLCAIPASEENQAMAMALLLRLYTVQGLERFTAEFFSLHNKVLPPSMEAARIFLQVHSDYGKGSAKENWAGSFLDWMRQKGLEPDLSIYSKLLHYASRQKDSEIIALVLGQVSLHEIKINRSFFKELASWVPKIGGFSMAKQLLQSAKVAKIVPDRAFYNSTVIMAMRESLLYDAVGCAYESIAADRHISPCVAMQLLDLLYQSWPLNSLIEVMARFHLAKLYGSNQLYGNFLRLAVSKRDIAMTIKYYRLILKTGCQPMPADSMQVLRLAAECGDLKGSYKVFVNMKSHGQLPKEIETFSCVLEEVLAPLIKEERTFLHRLYPMSPLQVSGSLEVLDFAIRKGAPLPSAWCHSVLVNTLATSNYNLARRIHTYMYTNAIPIEQGLGSRVIGSWNTHSHSVCQK